MFVFIVLPMSSRRGWHYCQIAKIRIFRGMALLLHRKKDRATATVPSCVTVGEFYAVA